MKPLLIFSDWDDTIVPSGYHGYKLGPLGIAGRGIAGTDTYGGEQYDQFPYPCVRALDKAVYETNGKKPTVIVSAKPIGKEKKEAK